MGAYFHEYNVRAFLLKYGAIVPGYVDASATGKSFFDGMIIEKWMMGINKKKILSLHKFCANVFRQPVERFEKRTVEYSLHANLPRQQVIVHLFSVFERDEVLTLFDIPQRSANLPGSLGVETRRLTNVYGKTPLGKRLCGEFKDGRERHALALCTLHRQCFHFWVNVEHDLSSHAYSLYIA